MIVRILALGFLFSLLGAAAAHYNFFPGTFYNNALTGLDSLFRQYALINHPSRASFDEVARTDARGVTINEPGAYQGYTLYTATDADRVYLMDMAGEVVHQWDFDYRTIWEKTESPIESLVDDQFIAPRRLWLQPNGDLLVLFNGVTVTPWGYGMIKLDKDSELVWANLQRYHHAIDVAPNGDIYTLEHEVDGEASKLLGKMARGPFIEEYLVIVDPDGEVKKRVNLAKAFFTVPSTPAVIWSFLPNSSGRKSGDYFHANDIEVLTEDKAAAFPMAKAGDVIVSMRDIHMLAMIDMELEAVTWIATGSWRAQHDPDFLPNGNILVYDNSYPRKGFGGQLLRSRIIELNPRTMALEWVYEGSEAHPFFSFVRGEIDPLPNGNVLVTESNGGRLFEVNRDKQVVWEFIHPERREAAGKSWIPVVNSGLRYAADELKFDFNAK